uniref:Uncharacterized protein n=1 Tax=Quercus lobata TaxID=97700 RepID=A0A7N2MD58_QUELO
MRRGGGGNCRLGVVIVTTFFFKNKTRDFNALNEKCTLDKDTLIRFRDRFQFPNETRVHLPRSSEKVYTFTHGEVCSYEVVFLSGLRFPICPFIIKPLHHLNINPGQLKPNLWKIVISCMEIWMIVNDGDTIRYFFVYGGGWETPFEDLWGDVPRLLCRWETPKLAKARPKLKSGYKVRVKVLGEMIHITTEYLNNKERVVMANSKVEALEAKSSKLRKNIITAMDGGNKEKEQVKALTKELQHNPSIDLEGLDFESVDKEMEADKAAETAVVAPTEGNVPKAKGDAPEPMVRDDTA